MHKSYINSPGITLPPKDYRRMQVNLLVTVAPSLATEAPSPSLRIFLNTLPSPVTSVTGLKDTNSTSMLRVELGGIE